MSTLSVIEWTTVNKVWAQKFSQLHFYLSGLNIGCALIPYQILQKENQSIWSFTAKYEVCLVIWTRIQLGAKFYSVLLDKSFLSQFIFQSWKLDYILTFKSFGPVAAPPSLWLEISFWFRTNFWHNCKILTLRKHFTLLQQFHLQFWHNFIVRQIKDFS